MLLSAFYGALTYCPLSHLIFLSTPWNRISPPFHSYPNWDTEKFIILPEVYKRKTWDTNPDLSESRTVIILTIVIRFFFSPHMPVSCYQSQISIPRDIWGGEREWKKKKKKMLTQYLSSRDWRVQSCCGNQMAETRETEVTIFPMYFLSHIGPWVPFEVALNVHNYWISPG